MTRWLTILLLVLVAPLSAHGQTVDRVRLAEGVTTDTTSTPVPAVKGTKTFWGEVVCSAGACVQTQAIYGAELSTATTAEALLLCTLTLTATTRDQDVCTGITANYPFLFVVTTSTSGTGATGAVYVFH